MPFRCIIIFLFFSCPLFAQLQFSLNADLSLELSKAGEQSHFFFNEIHRADTEWQVDMPQSNLVASIEFSPRWTLRSRFLLDRALGRRPGLFQDLDNYRLRIPQLALEWTNKEQDWTIHIGRFINPFGRFNQKQLPTRQTFVGRPLAYSYSTNITEYLGFIPGLGEDQVVILDDRTQWGSPHIYRDGYSTGFKINRTLKENKLHLTLALVNGAPISNPYHELSKPARLGLAGRLGWRPKYYWEQGFSISHGHFLRSSSVTQDLDRLSAFNQTLIGTDFLLGFQYFELSGELIYSHYRTPYTVAGDSLYIAGSRSLNSWSSYLDIKYEMPFFTGSYIASRIDMLAFGSYNDINGQRSPWDQNTVRLSMAFGYKISSFLLLRTTYSWQHTKGQRFDGADRALFRMMLTCHL